MMNELPFDPVELVLKGVAQAVQMLAGMIWALPFWAKVVVLLLILVRVRWPWMLAEQATVPRRRRRRWRRS
jgi:hypothetical protein